MREIKVWLRYTNNSFQQMLTSRFTMFIFMTGKLLRIGLFVIFLSLIFSGTKSLAGYSREQIIFFYLTFNLVDTLAQLLFREVYRFRQLVVTGGLDMVLIKPISPLIRVLLGGADVLDLLTLVIISLAMAFFASQNLTVTPQGILLFILLVLNALVVAAAFHIFVLGLGIITTNVDHLILIYRDMTSMARIPVDLYIEPIKFIITFILPLGIMITFPAKAFLGLLSPVWIVISLILGAAGLFFSLRFWNYSVKSYTSAS